MRKPTCKPSLDLTVDALDMSLTRDRYACLTNVAGFLECSDTDGIILLHDLCLEMNPMTPDTYNDSLFQALKILEKFADEHGLKFPAGGSQMEGSEEVNDGDNTETPARRRHHGNIREEDKTPLSTEEFLEAEEDERIFLAQCLRLHRNLVSNATTPLEYFLVNEVYWYDIGYRRTPDEMVEQINSDEHFRGYFNDGLRIANGVLRDYPDLVNPA